MQLQARLARRPTWSHIEWFGVSFRSLIKELMPDGSRGTGTWTQSPEWPPDAFAIAAKLALDSSCFLETRYSSADPNESFYSLPQFDLDLQLAREWRTMTKKRRVISRLNALWRIIIGVDATANDPEWQDSVMTLLAMSDEAACGIGFPPNEKRPSIHVDLYMLEAQQHNLSDDAENEADEQPLIFPESACIYVDRTKLVVLPKLMTPQVGLTLRSFSHHLALLPPEGRVSSSWRFAQQTGEPQTRTMLNLLLVPFPFVINDDCFGPGGPCGFGDAGEKNRFFGFDQTWLQNINAEVFASFLKDLCDQSVLLGSPIHGIVLPELALDFPLVQEVAEILGHSVRSLRFFIAGYHDGEQQSNKVYTSFYRDGNVLLETLQDKHHRWRLTDSQLKEYALDHKFPSDVKWWEPLKYYKRSINFYQVWRGACITTLICEDLARIEPVHEVLRAVGSNLVICLLMDGAQITKRWGGRYAMSLADDPGCSVLTFTSYGLMRRNPQYPQSREVALWKERGGDITEIKLAHGAHAVMLPLSPQFEQEFCMDSRSDGYETVKFGLSSYRCLTHPDPPKWIDS